MKRGRYEFNQLSLEDATVPKNPFCDEEVMKAIFMMVGDKALGHESNLLKGEIMEMMSDFGSIGGDIGCANSIFFTLLTKKCGAIDISDFCPISLLDGVYQIVAKCLVERLKLAKWGVQDCYQVSIGKA